MADKPQFVIALTGNPNSGKSTLFNAITGAHQHVGNYPGVTVEIKAGRCVHQDVPVEVVDLPGTYSLTARTLDEIIARNFLLDAKPNAVIDIVDCSNLERNLYLAMQLMELGAPLVLAFNKSDLADANGLKIDAERLSGLLGVPIVPTVGHKGRGIERLLDAALQVARDPRSAVAAQRPPTYGRELEPEIAKLVALAGESPARGPSGSPHAGRDRWVAAKLLEDDPEEVRRLGAILPAERMERLLAQAEQSRRHIEKVCGDDAAIILADRRYGCISGACQEAVRSSVEARHLLSDRIDAVVTNRLIGLPLFLVLMLAMFQLTFSVGGWLTARLDVGKEALAAGVWHLWPEGSQDPLRGLLVQGVIEGVGTVLSFVPMIFLLFLAIAVMEDSGYMARAAFITDRLMHRMGLHGRSFIPMLIGLGCTVPAILATRTLESRRDRLVTMLILPLISCSARLPIYILVLGAFFAPRSYRLLGFVEISNYALWLFGIYLVGVALAVVLARVLRGTIFRGEVTPFVMELPLYRVPTIRGALVHTWERGWLFLRKAGTVILLAVIVLWALSTWPRLPADRRQAHLRQRAGLAASAPADAERLRREIRRVEAAEAQAQLEHSAVGRIGKALEHVLRPCGFDWKVSSALVGALAAREVLVAQMGVIYAASGEGEQGTSLKDRIRAAYTPLQGACIVLFCLIGLPCVPTVAATWGESGTWKWALVQLGGLTLLAWLVCTAVYQIGSRAGWGA